MTWGWYARALLEGRAEAPRAAAGGKVIVEHTNINPNKAAHIGHLRNAVLGDTFVRMQRAAGRCVEVQNYIDNTGVQVADVVVGFHYLEKKTPDDVKDLICKPKFDYYCWDLYARVSQYYVENPQALSWRRDTLHAIEHGEGVLAEIGHLVADAIVDCHLDTMWRLGIAYDVLPRESEILHLRFWAKAFEQLKERGAIYYAEEGKNKGCWVMAASHFRESAAEEGGSADDAKVIVRSNGTVTYVGKDIAYQLWKFGLLGLDFHYKPLRAYPDGRRVWVATDEPCDEPAPEFGRGSEVYNVIDSRQSYLQDVVVAGLRALGYHEQAERSVHFSYEMVALSPRTCAILGIPLSDEDRKRPYVEVSGRKGLGVKAGDLIDKLIEKAKEEVDSRHPDRPDDERLAEAVELLLFDAADGARPARVIPIDPVANRTYHYWHVFLPGVRAGQIYAYRAYGPFDPSRGLRHQAHRRGMGRGRPLPGRVLHRGQLEGVERPFPRRRPGLLPRRAGAGGPDGRPAPG